MSTGDSPTSICNIALIALGETPLDTFPQTTTKRGILVSARYDDIRRMALRCHPWNCAMKQASIAAASAPPLFNWSNSFPLPVDFIRFYDQDELQDDTSIWRRFGNAIYSNQTSPLQINYIYDLQDCTKMDPDLVHVIAYQIAAELGTPITQNQSRTDSALKMMMDKYAIARFINAQENAPREWDVDILLRSRR